MTIRILAKAFYLLAVIILTVSCTPKNKSITSKNQANETEISKKTINEGEIKGVVTNDYNEVLPNATVYLMQNAEIIKNVNTDSNGFYILNDIAKGIYSLEFNADGFSSKKIINISIETNQKLVIDTVSIQMGKVALKPLIYLYPASKTEVTVALDYQGELTHTYPKYENGWTVTAEPNGTLWDKKGIQYYALFWEGKPTQPIVPKDGFVIAGDQTTEFLEEKLAEQGLNRREANEFMMFWLPLMENNPHNLIHFATAEYEIQAPLNISPAPETIIRVMMITQPLNDWKDFPLQNISSQKNERKGFTVVEWGGSIYNDIIKG